jgi:hypothetical protein
MAPVSGLAAFVSDPDRFQRFEHEARVVRSVRTFGWLVSP